ncbi:MAG: hypothetical protein Q8L77_10230 [Nitrospirota bacterium]|nr:hypothetical protein [Nitrospirota bacterium]
MRRLIQGVVIAVVASQSLAYANEDSFRQRDAETLRMGRLVSRMIAGPTPETSSNEQMRAATILAFKEYLDFREKARRAWDRDEIDQPTYLERRISQMQRIDVRGIDPALVKFFHYAVKEFTETLSYARQAQQEAATLNQALRFTGSVMDGLVEDDLDQFFRTLVGAGISRTTQADYDARWSPVFRTLNEKYKPEQKRLLKELSAQYDYAFYSILFGTE